MSEEYGRRDTYNSYRLQNLSIGHRITQHNTFYFRKSSFVHMVQEFTSFLAPSMTQPTLLYMFLIIFSQYYLTAGANCTSYISSIYLGVSISSLCFIFAVMQCAFTGGIFCCGVGGLC